MSMSATYEKDFVLAQYRSSLPAELNPIFADQIAASDLPLPPLALIPITELERKLLSDPGAPPPKQQGGKSRNANHHHNHHQSSNSAAIPAFKKDPWDASARGSSAIALGSFGADGVFSNDETPKRATNDIPVVSPAAAHAAASIEHHHPRATPKKDVSTFPFVAPNRDPEPARFMPGKWQYKDPTGAVQGPFLASEMHDWYKSQYFVETLPIKHTTDIDYFPLRELQLAYGYDRPFLADLEEAEKGFANRRPPAERNSRISASDWRSPEKIPAMSSQSFGSYGSSPQAYLPQRPIYPSHQTQQQPQSYGAGLGRGWNVQSSPVSASANDESYLQRAPSSMYAPFQNPFGSPFVPVQQFAHSTPSSNVATSGMFAHMDSPLNYNQHRSPLSPSHPQSEWTTDIPRMGGDTNSTTLENTFKREEMEMAFNIESSKSDNGLWNGAAIEESIQSHAPPAEKLKKQKKKSSDAYYKESASTADPFIQIVPDDHEEQLRRIQIQSERNNVETAAAAAWTASSNLAPKFSLKEIQENETRAAKIKQEQRNRIAAENLRLEALSLAEQDYTGIPGATVWGGSKNVTKKTMQEIMIEEKRRRQIIVEYNAAESAAADKRYADSAASAAPVSVDGWSKVKSGNKPAGSSDWNVVGKTKTVVAVPVASTPVPRPTVIRAPVVATSIPAITDPRTQWCRQALSVISSPAFNANMFIEMLMSIDHTSNASMIHTICDDTLGGYTAIDSRKFAIEFIRRRGSDDAKGWQTVSGAPRADLPRSSNLKGFEQPNKFVVVGGKKKKR